MIYHEDIRCITFDLDDTLWECWPTIKRAETALAEWLDEHYPRITSKFSREDLIDHRLAFMQTMPNMRHDLTYTRKQWLKHLAIEHGYLTRQQSQHISEAGFRIFWEERNNVTFLTGILDVLARLQQNYTLGTITNGNADIEYIGIDHLFDFSVKAEDAGVSKPHPDIYQIAVKKAGYAPSQILHVGDDPIGDIKGAQDAGMKTLWVNYKNKQWEETHYPDDTICNPLELEAAIGRINSS